MNRHGDWGRLGVAEDVWRTVLKHKGRMALKKLLRLNKDWDTRVKLQNLMYVALKEFRQKRIVSVVAGGTPWGALQLSREE